MYPKGVEGEFKTLLGPKVTNVSDFEKNGCHYWKLWAKEDGSLNIDYSNKLHPQLDDIIEQIKTDPYSRRHVIELWDHESVKSDELSLACCWHGMTLSVIRNTLHMTWVQRSVDTMIGFPSDVLLAYLFLSYISEETGYDIGSVMFSLSNVHIYTDHIEGAKELLSRSAFEYDIPLKFNLKK
jgi:thymidylate synthase